MDSIRVETLVNDPGCFEEAGDGGFLDHDVD